MFGSEPREIPWAKPRHDSENFFLFAPPSKRIIINSFWFSGVEVFNREAEADGCQENARYTRFSLRKSQRHSATKCFSLPMRGCVGVSQVMELLLHKCQEGDLIPKPPCIFWLIRIQDRRGNAIFFSHIPWLGGLLSSSYPSRTDSSGCYKEKLCIWSSRKQSTKRVREGQQWSAMVVIKVFIKILLVSLPLGHVENCTSCN